MKQYSDQHEWEQTLLNHVKEALKERPSAGVMASSKLSLALLGANTKVADGQTAYLLGQDHVLLVSPSNFPDTSFEEAEKAFEMKRFIGPDAGRVILDPIARGRAEGRSFFVVERCKPIWTGRLAGRLGRWMVQDDVLGWLRQMTAAAQHVEQGGKHEFIASLDALGSMDALPPSIRSAAREKLQQLQADEIVARHIPMHGDLWVGNLMRRKNGDLIVIDWGGSEIVGYGFFDLIRIASSLSVSKRKLRREIGWHADALGGSAHDAEMHLLSALGHYCRSLGQFPMAQFVDMAKSCWELMLSVRRK